MPASFVSAPWSELQRGQMDASRIQLEKPGVGARYYRSAKGAVIIQRETRLSGEAGLAH
jgi:hypothetical protein